MGTGPAARRPIIVNWAAPDTMIGRREQRESLRKAGVDGEDPVGQPKRTYRNQDQDCVARAPWRNDGLPNIC